MSDKRHTAIHEAGHAVIGRAVALPCGGATIVPNGDLGSYGAATVGSADDAWHQWQLREKFRDYLSAVRARIITVQAGHEAEAEILGLAIGNDDDDREVAAACAEDLGVPVEREDAVVDRLRRAARQFVRRHRTDIERVAAALEERSTLTGEEIDALLPPTFMSRPVTWDLALPKDDEALVILRQPPALLS